MIKKPKKLSTYKTCKVIRYVMLKRAGECICSNFENDHTNKDILEIVSLIRGSGGNESIEPINPNDLTERQMIELGFRVGWDNSKIMLIPIWIFPFVVDDFVCCSTDDNIQRPHKRTEMSVKNFGGWMDYGILPKN